MVLTIVALIGVKPVVVAESGHQVLGVHRTTEELKPVVGDAVSFQVVSHRATAHAAERPTVDFLVGRQLLAAVPHRHVAHRARAIVIVAATKTVQVVDLTAHRIGHSQVRQTFIDVVRHVVGRPTRVVQPGIAEEDDAAPQTARREGQVARVGHVVRDSSENDGPIRCAVGVELAASANKQAAEVVGRAARGAGARGTLHHRARLDVQDGVAHHVGEARQDVRVGRHPGMRSIQVAGRDVDHITRGGANGDANRDHSGFQSPIADFEGEGIVALGIELRCVDEVRSGPGQGTQHRLRYERVNDGVTVRIHGLKRDRGRSVFAARNVLR